MHEKNLPDEKACVIDMWHSEKIFCGSYDFY